eukprot:6177897-Pleurochrysis_carterae.AAC.3
MRRLPAHRSHLMWLRHSSCISTVFGCLGDTRYQLTLSHRRLSLSYGAIQVSDTVRNRAAAAAKPRLLTEAADSATARRPPAAAAG